MVFLSIFSKNIAGYCLSAERSYVEAKARESKGLKSAGTWSGESCGLSSSGLIATCFALLNGFSERISADYDCYTYDYCCCLLSDLTL